MVVRVRAAVLTLTPRGVGLLTASGAVAFVALRLARLGGGAGTFVVAGNQFTDPATVPGGIPVLEGSGFDGQFFYRLAHDPTSLGMGRVHGILFDYAVRPGRILYPALAWLVSLGGRSALLPWAMIAVNVAAVTALGVVGALLALDHGRRAVWGLAIAGFWGFGFVLGRDLSELVTAAAIFAVILLVGRTHYLTAGLVGALAVLGREQAMMLVVVIALGVFVCEWRRRSSPQALRSALATLVPSLVTFGVWQSICRHVTGEYPFRSSSQANSTWPFADFPRAFGRWGEQIADGFETVRLSSVVPLLTPLCLVALLALVGWSLLGGGCRAAWRTRPWEPLVLAVSVLVLVCGTSTVIDVPADFRQSSELAGSAWLMLWSGSERSRTYALAVVAPVTVAALAVRCLVL